jgi:hypothetical protein
MADLVNEHYPNDWRSTFFNTIRPKCTPCPPHAQCLDNLEMRCNEDFIYKPHPFRLNDILPLAGECIPDTEKQRRIAIVAERALGLLRDKAARVECNDETPVGLMEKNIKAELLKYKSGSLSDEEFDALFEAAIGEVEKRDEVTVITQPGGSGAKYVPHISLLIADRLSTDNVEFSNPVISPESLGDVNSEKVFSDPWDEIEKSLLVQSISA